jgi:hypothetical protein
MTRAVLLCVVLLGGCTVNCERDWYYVGVNDGRMNAGRQAALEGHSGYCGPKVDATRYDEGYRLGESQRPKSSL